MKDCIKVIYLKNTKDIEIKFEIIEQTYFSRVPAGVTIGPLPYLRKLQPIAAELCHIVHFKMTP